MTDTQFQALVDTLEWAARENCRNGTMTFYGLGVMDALIILGYSPREARKLVNAAEAIAHKRLIGGCDHETVRPSAPRIVDGAA